MAGTKFTVTLYDGHYAAILDLVKKEIEELEALRSKQTLKTLVDIYTEDIQTMEEILAQVRGCDAEAMK